MKKISVTISVCATIVLGSAILAVSGCVNSQEPKQAETRDSLPANKISNRYAIPPLDITAQSQALADTFSWRTFIAMNWPADGNTCGPDTTSGMNILTGKGPLVWETYLSSDQVFVSAPNKPFKWCEPYLAENKLQSLPKSVRELAQKTGVYRFIHRNSKVPHSLDQASGQPLVDQNGRFVRYEVRMNQDEYNYIMAKSLWNVAGQKAYTKDSLINFPAGPSRYGPLGAMEFKAAWKVLGKGDDPSRFYTIRAIVFNDDSLNPSPGPNPVTLGLVGLHIAHKTASQRFWVWSTFEQVDNLTTSFFNSKCDSCAVNQPPSGGPDYKELGKNGQPLHKPTQVTRVNAVDSLGDPFIDNINVYFRSLLKGSVWNNYTLVGTEWLLNEDVFPLFLANSVQETYMQGPNPPFYGKFKIDNGEQYFQSKDYHPFANGISSSCMGCHYSATIPSNSKAKADLSFMLGEAK